MRRRHAYLAVVVTFCGASSLTLLSSCGKGGQPADQRRNVLLITMDTTRADALGCYGNEAARTPRLDALAKQGVLFEHCQTCCPQTLPSHTSIMTGLYPYVHGVRRNGVYRVDPAVQTLAESMKSAGYTTAATVATFVLEATFGLNQGFDIYHDVSSTSDAKNRERVERRGDEIANDALALLDQIGDKPFFLWVHFFDPHYPYDSRFHADKWSHEAYADEVTYMDGQIGRILDELQRRKLADNTLVVIVADHGEAFGEHGELDHGYFVYETTVHVPLLMRGAGLVPADRRVTSLVRTIDLAPTVLDLLDLPALPEAQGTSVRPLIEDSDAEEPRASYTESMEANAVFGMSRLRGYTFDDWKYMLSTSPQLFHLSEDPREDKNLAQAALEKADSARQDLWTLIADAPPLITSDTEAPDLTAEQSNKLLSIGYVGGTAEKHEKDAVEVDSFDPAGPDVFANAETITLYTRARRRMNEHQLQTAEQELRKVLAAMPDSYLPTRDLAYVLQGERQTDEAARMYRHAIELAPADLQTRLMLGTLLIDAGRWAEAREALNAVRERDPQNFSAHFLLGMAYYQQKDYAKAAEWFQKALEIDPKSDQAKIGLERCEKAEQPAAP